MQNVFLVCFVCVLFFEIFCVDIYIYINELVCFFYVFNWVFFDVFGVVKKRML